MEKSAPLKSGIKHLGLQAFVTIAERGSFQAAASHLNLSQTALSHRIRKLEESLSAQLLQRTTRRVSLTPAGAALLPRARKIFNEVEAALDEVRATRAEAEQRIAIASLPTIAMQCLPRAIAAFTRTNPTVQVKVHDNSASEIAEKVQSGEAEFGVTMLAANRWDLELKPVVKEPFVLVCHRSTPFADASALTWNELIGLPLVRVSAETGNRILIDDALGVRREAMTWRYEVQRVTTAVAMVSTCLCYAIVPKLAYDVVKSPELILIPLSSPNVTRTLGIITRKDAPMGSQARQLLKLVTAALKSSVTLKL